MDSKASYCWIQTTCEASVFHQGVFGVEITALHDQALKFHLPVPFCIQRQRLPLHPCKCLLFGQAQKIAFLSCVTYIGLHKQICLSYINLLVWDGFVTACYSPAQCDPLPNITLRQPEAILSGVILIVTRRLNLGQGVTIDSQSMKQVKSHGKSRAYISDKVCSHNWLAWHTKMLVPK